MPMSFDGPVASTSGWFIRPRAEETGSTGAAGRRRSSLPTGPYVMATAGHREPCDSRGSCTVLGAPGGESPPGDSPKYEELISSICFPLYTHERTLLTTISSSVSGHE